MLINKKVIGGYAPILYKSILRHLKVMKYICDFNGCHTEMRFQVERFMRSMGLSAADVLSESYDPSIIENEEFRLILILYTCVCIITDSSMMEMGEFATYMQYIRDSVGDLDSGELIKYFCDMMKVDPKIVPQYIQKKISTSFEEKAANNICEKRFEKLDGPNDYVSFELYHEYMEKNAQKLINDLNTEGFTNTYPLDLMTILLILKKHNFPILNLYSVDQSLPAPRGIIDVLAKKLFTLRQNGGIPPNGGIIDFGSDTDD